VYGFVVGAEEAAGEDFFHGVVALDVVEDVFPKAGEAAFFGEFAEFVFGQGDADAFVVLELFGFEDFAESFGFGDDVAEGRGFACKSEEVAFNAEGGVAPADGVDVQGV